jgi:hypothetical protein
MTFAFPLFSQARPVGRSEYAMRSILQGLRIVIAAVLASAISSLPACGTMGSGGGMHYLTEPSLETAVSTNA